MKTCPVCGSELKENKNSDCNQLISSYDELIYLLNKRDDLVYEYLDNIGKNRSSTLRSVLRELGKNQDNIENKYDEILSLKTEFFEKSIEK